MKSKWRSRTVYIATIAAMSMMVAGFALASGLFAGFGAFSVSGNQGSITTTGTIYASGLSGSLFTTGTSGGAGTCTAPSTSGTGTDILTVTGWVAGGPGACDGAADYVLQLTFTATGLPGPSYTDSFVVSSEFGAATSYTASSVTITCAVTENPSTCNAVIDIDTGIATSAAQPNVDAVDVTVTGS